jgi:hypothetical protein
MKLLMLKIFALSHLFQTFFYYLFDLIYPYSNIKAYVTSSYKSSPQLPIQILEESPTY